jgi:hypothetical protein
VEAKDAAAAKCGRCGDRLFMIQSAFTAFCPAAMLFKELGLKPGPAFHLGCRSIGGGGGDIGQVRPHAPDLR